MALSVSRSRIGGGSGGRFSMTVEGTDLLIATFKATDSLLRQHIRAVMNDTVTKVRDAAVANAPEKSGALKGGIRKRVSENENRITAWVRTGRDQFYGYMLEGGVDNDKVKVGRYQRWIRTRRAWVSAYQRKLYIEARHFMTNALDRYKDEIADRLFGAIWEAAEKANNAAT